MPLSLNTSFIKNEKNLINNFIKTYSNSIFHDFTSITPTENNIISVGVNPNNGFMIAVVNDGSSSDLIYSNDGGVTWTYYSKDLTSQWKSITYGNGKFVVVGSGPTNYAMYSTSSSPISSNDWTYVTTIPTQSWIKIIYSANTFVAISSASSSTRKILISNDGINWNSITSPNDLSTNLFSDIAYGNGRFVIITASITGLNNVIYSNNNGLTWNISTNGSISSDSYSSPRICYSHKLGIFLILNVTSDQTKISYSKYGQVWTVGTKEYSDSWDEVNQLIWINELEMFVLFGVKSNKFIISTSFDGLNWSRKYTDTVYKKFTSLIWNIFYGTLVGISTYVSSSSDVSILTTKPLGINHLLSNYYYSNTDIPESLNYNLSNYTTSINTLFYIHPILNINNDFIEYSISPSLPTGVSINVYNGVISGSTNTVQSSTQYIISAKHLISENIIRTKIKIEITSTFNSITSFYYNNQKDAEIFLNTRGISYFPFIVGSNPITYSLKSGSTLPIGLYLKKDTGEIFGDVLIPNSPTIYNITIIGVNSSNSLEASFKITTKDLPIINFNYNNRKDIIKQINSNLNILPSINTGTNIQYSISPSFSIDFPSLTFNTSNGLISGTLPNSEKNVLFTITATNSNNTILTKLRIVTTI